MLILLRLLDPLPACATGITIDDIPLHTIDRATLRQRLQTAVAENNGANGGPGVKTTGTRLMPVDPAGIPTHPPTPSEILSHHPDGNIAALAKAHVELERELTGPVEGKVRWPANITLRDFAWYQLTPTLVYELEYPRTERIRPLYVFEKTVAFFGTGK